MIGGSLGTRLTERLGQRVDPEVVRVARGALIEVAGTALRNEQMADRGRLEQFHAVRRRQVRKSRLTWSQMTWGQRAGVLISRVKR